MKRLRFFGKKLLSLALCLALALTSLAALPGTRADAAGKKLIALTFDDGPGPYTARLLDGLKEKGVKATFFTLGQRVQSYPTIIRRIFDEGHQLCNHSYDHPQLTAISTSSGVNQIYTTNTLLNRVTGGNEVYCVRSPYGSMSASVRSQVGYAEIYWSVDTLDWKYRDAAYVKNAVLNQAFDGAVVLMHDIHPTTVTGVLQAIDTLKARGYELVTVREMFRRRGTNMTGRNVYYRCDPNGVDLGAPVKPEIALETVEDGLRVTLTTPSAGAKIYYTLDGSGMGWDSRVYSGPFIVKSPCTLRAVSAYHMNGGRSPELSCKLTSFPAHPVTAVLEGSSLRFDGIRAGEVVAYTLNGADPTRYGALYNGPIALKPGTLVRYYTRGAGLKATSEKHLYYSSGGNAFDDVLPGDWFAASVDEAVSLKAMVGVGGFSFRPEGEMTRGMAVTVLFRISGDVAPTGRTNVFRDVKDGDYFAPAVEWAYRLGVAAGTAENAFSPDRPITRQELCHMMMNYLRACAEEPGPEETPGDGLPDEEQPAGEETEEAGEEHGAETGEASGEAPEEDAEESGGESEDETGGASPEEPEEPAGAHFRDWESVAEWARNSVSEAVSLGLMVGDGPDTFGPETIATRAQAAAVLCRLHHLPDGADLNRGFCGRISAHAASEALKIHKGFPAAFSLPGQKSAPQKLSDLKSEDFRGIFGAENAGLLA